MSQKRPKTQLNATTYVTQRNGKLFLVRKKPSNTVYEAAFSWLGDILGSPSHKEVKKQVEKQVKVSETGATLTQTSMATPGGNSAAGTFPFDSNANLIGPSAPLAVMGSKSSQPGMFQFGDRQLELRPLSMQGNPHVPPDLSQFGFQPPPDPWMFDRNPNFGGYNFPPMGYNPQQFMMNSTSNDSMKTQTSVKMQLHICAHCKRPRSRKYQHENPLKPGEDPTPAFCGRCQKDETSSESESARNTSKKETQRDNFDINETSKSEVDHIKDGFESTQSSKSARTKMFERRKVTDLLPDEDLTMGEERGRSNRSSRSSQIRPHYQTSYESRPYHRSPSSSFSAQPRPRPTTRRDIPQEHRQFRRRRYPSADRWVQELAPESITTDNVEGFYRGENRKSYSKAGATKHQHHPKNTKANNQNSGRLSSKSHKANSFDESRNSRSTISSIEPARRHRAPKGTIRDQEAFREGENVAAEHYMSQPEPPAYVIEENIKDVKQTNSEKAIVRAKKDTRWFVTTSEASNYYQDDWSEAKHGDQHASKRIRPRDLKSIFGPATASRPDAREKSTYKDLINQQVLPSAPTPPKIFDSSEEEHIRTAAASRAKSAHPLSDQYVELSESSEEYSSSDNDDGGVRQITQGVASITNHRPPYVKEATDGGTEKDDSLLSYGRSREDFYNPGDDSGSTEDIVRAESYVVSQQREAGDFVGEIAGRRRRPSTTSTRGEVHRVRQRRNY